MQYTHIIKAFSILLSRKTVAIPITYNIFGTNVKWMVSTSRWYYTYYSIYKSIWLINLSCAVLCVCYSDDDDDEFGS